jgi:hypothetical protein
MTGLSARVLASAFGISREQYSRWVSGKPISDIRKGQLQFLHTVVRELLRRLGKEDARAWLHMPIDGAITPVALLESRQFDKFYRYVVSLPPPPVSPKDVGLLSLSAPMQDTDEEESPADQPWSPYDSGAIADS